MGLGMNKFWEKLRVEKKDLCYLYMDFKAL